MSAKASSQYTVRNVPRSVDRALRSRARAQDRSLNDVLLEALTAAAGVGQAPRSHHDLDHLIGSWVSDPETDAALAEERVVDPRDWP